MDSNEVYNCHIQSPIPKCHRKEFFLNSGNTPAYHAEQITQYPLIHQGKVRDSFAIDDQHMLIVASDRLSAFDVVMSEPIPGKGEILTRIANFWFERTQHIIPNHLSGVEIEEVIDDPQLLKVLKHRSVVVKRLKPLPLEAIVRGYIIGSGWNDYQQTGSICGISLPAGLRQADKLPEVIFTPSKMHKKNPYPLKMRKVLGRKNS